MIAATTEQRERFVDPLMRGETTACFAMTEPGAGSDFPSMRTRARRDGGDWVLDGHKALITWAPFADVAVIVARTSDERGPRSLSAFFVPKGTPGFETGPLNRTIMDDGVTGELRLDGCRVSDAFMLGEVGQGFHLAMAFINWRRVCRGGLCSGLAEFLLTKTLSYVRKRETFGQPLASRQFVQFTVADMYLDLEAMCAFSLDRLRIVDAHDIWRLESLPPEAVRAISAVKAWCDEALYRIADRALQLHGGWGLVSDTGIEQVFRVARNLRIPAGTVEMQKLSIARTLGLSE